MNVQVNNNPEPRQLYLQFSDEPVMKPVAENKADVSSALLRQYRDLKAKHPDALLLFRSSDFYFSFEEDARNASECLGITLTRHDGRLEAAFPYHALDTYLPKLIRNGFRVAICDMITAPKRGR